MYQGESKVNGAIIEGSLIVEGLEMWIANEYGDRTAVWPDSVQLLKNSNKETG